MTQEEEPPKSCSAYPSHEKRSRVGPASVRRVFMLNDVSLYNVGLDAPKVAEEIRQSINNNLHCKKARVCNFMHTHSESLTKPVDAAAV